MKTKKISTRRARQLAALAMEHPNSPIGKPITSERAREIAGMRRTFASGGKGGRPRSTDQPRCFCQAMTLKRALARGHECHDPGEAQA